MTLFAVTKLFLPKEKILISKPDVLYALRLAVTLVLFELAVGWLIARFDRQLADPFVDWPIYEKFFTIVIFAPILETLVCQYLPIKLVLTFANDSNSNLLSRVAVGVSTVVFASMHNYSISYVLYTILPGLILANSFMHFANKYKRFSEPFLYTSLIHFIANVLAFVVSFFP